MIIQLQAIEQTYTFKERKNTQEQNQINSFSCF